MCVYFLAQTKQQKSVWCKIISRTCTSRHDHISVVYKHKKIGLKEKPRTISQHVFPIRNSINRFKRMYYGGDVFIE